MKLLHSQSLKLVVVFSVTFALCFSTIISPPLQAQTKPPAPTTHVSDIAGAIAEPVRLELENTLSSLQQRSSINLTILTVQTTSGQDIFDYSADVARAWDIGFLASAKKSLLVVVSVEEKTLSIRYSKRVQKDLPEGALTAVIEQMRGPISSGHIAEAVLLGVQKIVPLLAAKLGFNTEGMAQAPAAQGSLSAPSDAAGNSADAAVSTQPTSASLTEPKPTAAAAKLTDEDKSPALTKRESVVASNKTSLAKPGRKNAPVDDAQEAEDVEVTLADPLPLRIDKLKDFIATHPDSKSKGRATELLIVARAALGDEKLKAGETAAGVELLFQALAEASTEMSDKLFSGVVSQIPLNLYVRGEASASLKAAQQIEAKVASNPRRLLALSGFYLEIERGDEATRLAEQAIRLAPELAEAHNALGLALQISLRLDEAAAEYKRALELDPKTRGARRALADLDRAAGKFAEALALYREQLTAESADKPARAGLVISLFELGKIDEAKEELQSALKDDPRNLLLLTGAAYWLQAHAESREALALAQKAVNIEPRYTWAQIALARSLVAQKQPLYGERSIRYARQYGRFPTLDYELASTLASLGLYEEAGQTLLRSFTLKDGQIETQLANRIPARAAGFLELLAPERRASIFQPTAADSEDNARILKELLVFMSALNPPNTDAKIDEASVIAAAREFAAGTDNMRTYRQLYAASRLLQRGIAFQVAQELSDAARDGIEAATYIPAVTVAVQADELGDIRARAIAAGGTPDIPEAPRNVLANILRGRIEELSGWALFNLDKTAEATERLRRAMGILPVGTPLWQTAGWHLGVALQQAGNDAEALGFYIKSYTSGGPDPARRSVIEQLYKKINGSLDGLDDRIGPASIATSAPAAGAANKDTSPVNTQPPPELRPPLAEASPSPGPTPTPEAVVARPTPTPEAMESPNSTSERPAAQPTPSPSPSSQPTPAPTSTPGVEPSPSPSPSAEATKAATSQSAPTANPNAETTTPKTTPTPTPTPEVAPTTTPTAEATPAPQATPTPAPTPEETPAPTPTPAPASGSRPRRVKPPR